MCRFETGQHCFTWMENERLICCAWLTYPDAALPGANTNLLTNNYIELKELYHNNISKEQVQLFLNNIIDAVGKERHCDRFLTNNKLVCQALDTRGMACQKTPVHVSGQI
jgi:hypothetical protein